jgi:hypothetical protein
MLLLRSLWVIFLQFFLILANKPVQSKPNYPVTGNNPYGIIVNFFNFLDNYMPPSDRVYTKPFDLNDTRQQQPLLKPNSLSTNFIPSSQNLIQTSSYLPPTRSQPNDSRFSSFIPEPIKTQYMPEKKEPLKIQSPKKDVDPSQCKMIFY